MAGKGDMEEGRSRQEDGETPKAQVEWRHGVGL